MKIKTQSGYLTTVLILVVIILIGYILLQKSDVSDTGLLDQNVIVNEPVIEKVVEKTNIDQSSSTQNIVVKQEIKQVKDNQAKDTFLTYTNASFGFAFNYPVSWKVLKEIGTDTSYQPPYLFDTIITTDNHPINKAGHVSVIALSLDVVMAESKKSTSAKIEGLSDFKTTDFIGKKFKVVYQPVSGSSIQQIDYVYALALGDKTLYISFMSMNTPEKQISEELELQIDQMVKTVSKI